jgi:hypothetical protein
MYTLNFILFAELFNVLFYSTMSFDKMSFDKTLFDEMLFDEMSFDEMSLDEMSRIRRVGRDTDEGEKFFCEKRLSRCNDRCFRFVDGNS